MTPRVNRAEFNAIIRKARARKAKRAEKRRQLRAALPIRHTRRELRAKLDGLWSLLVKARDGMKSQVCRVCGRSPGEVAYHIVPKQRGDAVRWLPENGVLACAACNMGEMLNRSLYRERHKRLFGAGLVEWLEAKAAEGAKFSLPDLVAMRDDLKARIESGNYGGANAG